MFRDHPPRLLDRLAAVLHGQVGADLHGDPLILVERLQVVEALERLAVLLLGHEQPPLALQRRDRLGVELDRLVEHLERLVRRPLFLVVARQGEERLGRLGLLGLLVITERVGILAGDLAQGGQPEHRLQVFGVLLQQQAVLRQRLGIITGGGVEACQVLVGSGEGGIDALGALQALHRVHLLPCGKLQGGHGVVERGVRLAPGKPRLHHGERLGALPLFLVVGGEHQPAVQGVRRGLHRRGEFALPLGKLPLAEVEGPLLQMGRHQRRVELGGPVQLAHAVLEMPLGHVGAAEQVMGRRVRIVVVQQLLDLGYAVVGPLLGDERLGRHQTGLARVGRPVQNQAELAQRAFQLPGTVIAKSQEIVAFQRRGELYRLLQGRQGVIVFLPVEAHQPLQPVPVAALGGFLDHRVGDLVRLVELPLLDVDHAELVARRALVGVELQDLLIYGNRLVALAAPLFHRGQHVERLEVARVGLDHLVQVRLGLVHPAGRHADRGKLKLGCGARRVHLERLHQVALGLRIFLTDRARGAEHLQRIDAAGVLGEVLLPEGERLIPLPGAVVEPRQLQQDLVARGVLRQDLGELLFRLLCLAERGIGLGQLETGIGIIGVLLQGVLEIDHGPTGVGRLQLLHPFIVEGFLGLAAARAADKEQYQQDVYFFHEPHLQTVWDRHTPVSTAKLKTAVGIFNRRHSNLQEKLLCDVGFQPLNAADRPLERFSSLPQKDSVHVYLKVDQRQHERAAGSDEREIINRK